MPCRWMGWMHRRCVVQGGGDICVEEMGVDTMGVVIMDVVIIEVVIMEMLSR